MGPTNQALAKLFTVEQRLHEAEARLKTATRHVRLQQQKVSELASRIEALEGNHKLAQAKAMELESDLKQRDAHIEQLRTKQQNAANNREYQALLIQINTEKVDRNEVEENAIKALEEVERLGAELAGAKQSHQAESATLENLKSQIGDRVAQLQADIDALRPQREAAAAAVSSGALEMFERLSERFEGEAMAPIVKTNPRREEYCCSACNMSLVVEVYNRLRTRDEPVSCPSCQRLLFIPEELTPESALHVKAAKRARGKSQEQTAEAAEAAGA